MHICSQTCRHKYTQRKKASKQHTHMPTHWNTRYFLLLHLVFIKMMPFLPETRSSLQTLDTPCSLFLAYQMHPRACEADISPMLGMWWMTRCGKGDTGSCTCHAESSAIVDRTGKSRLSWSSWYSDETVCVLQKC